MTGFDEMKMVVFTITFLSGGFQTYEYFINKLGRTKSQYV